MLTLRCRMTSPSLASPEESPRVKCSMQSACLSRQSLSSMFLTSLGAYMLSPKQPDTKRRSCSGLFSPVILARRPTLPCLETLTSPERTRAPSVYFLRPKLPMNCGSLARLSRRSMPPVTPKYCASMVRMRSTISSLLSSGGNSSCSRSRSSRAISL